MSFRFAMQALIVGVVTTGLVLTQNCSPQKVSFNEKTAVLGFSSDQALVYGADAQDRQFLANKVAGYQAPGLNEIFDRWRRFSGPTIYNTAADIIPETAYAFCFSGFTAAGDWKPTTNPNTGVAIANPGVHIDCIPSVSFAAASWLYLTTTKRLRIATNANNYNGFISALKFDRFTSEAVVTSVNIDDDEIGLVIALAVDTNGDLHTLSAMRAQGGSSPTNGWGFIHRKNGTNVRTFSNISVGGTNKNTAPTTGDAKGWNGRKTKIQVVRTGDKIVAKTSLWGANENNLPLEPTSEITLDLSVASYGLSIFQGPQYHGYSSRSQYASEYISIKFTTTTDDRFLFDLRDNKVYEQQQDGTYAIRNDLDAFVELGFPKVFQNPETQKAYLLHAYRGFLLQ